MKKVVVIGASAGGIKAVCALLKEIRPDIRAAFLVVIHVSETTSALPEVLQRCTALPVVDCRRPQPIRAGHVYVAPPNRHLVIKAGCAQGIMGPRENRHRPSVDTLFRSAARAYRRNVVAVVLTGALDDGSAGSLAIKSRGGKIIVQDPKEAEVPDMPRNVLEQVAADHCLTLKQIPPVLVRLASDRKTAHLPESTSAECTDEPAENELAAKSTEPSGVTCPECGGVVLQIRDGDTIQWRCHVGHRYSFESFTEAQAEAVERAVWVALRKLKERQLIQEQLADDPSQPARLRKRFREDAEAAAADIKLLEEVLARL